MNNKKLLYIDDEEQNLVGFYAELKRSYKIFCARNVEEASKLLEDNPDIAVIITDEKMPGMNGIEFLTKITPKYPDIIKIILTGFTDKEILFDAINKGEIYRYIVKPFNFNYIRMNIDSAFTLYELRMKNKLLLKDLEEKVRILEEQQRIIQHQASLAAIGQLSSSISHDIKNKINIIDGILNREGTPDNKQEARSKKINQRRIN